MRIFGIDFVLAKPDESFSFTEQDEDGNIVKDYTQRTRIAFWVAAGVLLLGAGLMAISM